MKFRPLHDRVVVRRLDEDTKTAGGIIIPDPGTSDFSPQCLTVWRIRSSRPNFRPVSTAAPLTSWRKMPISCRAFSTR